MRTAMILARRHDSDHLEVISGPATALPEQKELFKAFKGIREHRDFSEVQLWESDRGCTSKVRLDATDAEPTIDLPTDPQMHMVGLAGELAGARDEVHRLGQMLEDERQKGMKLGLEVAALRKEKTTLERMVGERKAETGDRKGEEGERKAERGERKPETESDGGPKLI